VTGETGRRKESAIKERRAREGARGVGLG